MQFDPTTQQTFQHIRISFCRPLNLQLVPIRLHPTGEVGFRSSILNAAATTEPMGDA